VRVDLDPGVFDGKWDLELLGIFALALDGRHRVFAPQQAIDGWPPMGHPHIGDTVSLVLAESLRCDLLGSPVDILRVSGAPVAWAPPANLTPTHAFRFLARPLRVILENGSTDRNFLLAFATRSERQTLEDAEREGWLHFESGGGIHGVCERLEALLGRPELAARVFAICDSDRRMPGEASSSAQEVRRVARRLTRGMNIQDPDWIVHILERRAAENYVSPGRILAYACQRFGQDAVSALHDYNRQRVSRDPSAKVGGPAAENG
jgi:hypothetical protein